MERINKGFETIKNNLELLPLILLSAVVPLILYAKYFVISPVYNKFYFPLGYAVDLYSYYKMIIISLSGFIMFCILMINYDKVIRKLKQSKFLLAICSLQILLILSTLFSEYSGIALLGFVDRFEGFTVISTYLIAVIYCSVFVTSTEKVIFLLKGIMISSFLVSIYGVLEFYGYVLLTQEWFAKLILPKLLEDSAQNMRYSYTHRVSSTLYNPNFVGSYMAMTIMSTIGLSYVDKKNHFKYVLIALFSFSLIGSQSSAGVVALIAAFILGIFGVFILKKENQVTYKNMFITIIIFSIVAIAIPITTNETSFITREVEGIDNKTDTNYLSEHKFGEIKLENGVMTIPFDNHEFNMKLDGDKLSFFDENNEELEYTLYTKENKMNFEKVGFEDIELLFTKESSNVKLNFGQLELGIGFGADGVKYVDPMENIYTSTNVIEKIGFEGNETFGSSRGYIWSRSLPILSSTLILGKGPDTFPLYFPQNDITGKINWLAGYNKYVDKPHNMFIQMGVNQGVLSLLIFIGIIIMLGINLLREKDKITPLRVFIYVAVFAYCVAGVFNDSNVCVAPVFWTILGLSIAFQTNDIEEAK